MEECNEETLDLQADDINEQEKQNQQACMEESNERTLHRKVEDLQIDDAGLQKVTGSHGFTHNRKFRRDVCYLICALGVFCLGIYRYYKFKY